MSRRPMGGGQILLATGMKKAPDALARLLWYGAIDMTRGGFVLRTQRMSGTKESK